MSVIIIIIMNIYEVPIIIMNIYKAPIIIMNIYKAPLFAMTDAHGALTKRKERKETKNKLITKT